MLVTPELTMLAADEQWQQLARKDLIAFSRWVDRAADKEYRAEHLRRIADVLQQVERGELRRVIVAVPPRHWKSSLSSEKFPAWWLGLHPKSSIIVASYALSLAEKFSKSVRSTIGSERYRDIFKDVAIKRDSNSADDWLLDGGYRTSFRAVGTGGGISGHGARLILLDDVSDPNKINSTTQTDADWNWYKNVIRTRLEPSGAIVIVNNRVGVNDLAGYLLDPQRNDSADPPEDWTYIEIPAYDKDTDRYLWESRFGREYYQKLELDTTLWRVQYMQRPTIESGTEIRREWFEFVETLPKRAVEQVRVFDTALTLKKTAKSDPDYTATIGSSYANNWLYLIRPAKRRAESPEVVEWIRQEKLARPAVRFGMAKAMTDTGVKQFLKRDGIPVEDLAAEHVDLRARLSVFLYFARNGRVKLVGTQAEWAQFLDEATAFPNGKHDDLLACCAGITQMLNLTTDPPKPPSNHYDYAMSETINRMADDM